MRATSSFRGTLTDRGFVVDHRLRTPEGRELHFSLSLPEGFDASSPTPLYVALPGWEGLYFQGVGAHLVEDMPFTARECVPELIIVSPQLDDWGETSARDTIELTRWLIAAYNADPARVLLSGYSGGGETVSIVLGREPSLYVAALHMASRWSGEIPPLIQARTPLYMAVGESDDYYGSEPDRLAYAEMVRLYTEAGLTQSQIDEILTLDMKPASYFEASDAAGGQHGRAVPLFARDKQITNWFFAHAR